MDKIDSPHAEANALEQEAAKLRQEARDLEAQHRQEEREQRRREQEARRAVLDHLRDLSDREIEILATEATAFDAGAEVNTGFLPGQFDRF